MEHAFHDGEVQVHNRMGLPKDLTDSMVHWTRPSMPDQHRDFFSELDYFIVGSLDSEGRPWASILTGNHGFIQSSNPNNLHFETRVLKQDPLVQNLRSTTTVRDIPLLFAGLGIEFSNRRRNKVAGRITSSSIEDIDGAFAEVTFEVQTTESIGNCPKYIPIRDIVHKQRPLPELLHHQPHCPAGTPMHPEAVALIESSDIAFIATRHLDHDRSDMDVNNRGGAPGFIRVSSDRNTIFLPDYSGNRLFSSLGNIESDKVAGLVFTDFTKGDVLYLTGTAQNFFDDDARELIPRSSRLTRIQVTGFTYIIGGLDLAIAPGAIPQPSPYNPPVKFLKDEDRTGGSEPRQAIICDVLKHSSSISTFTFTVDSSIIYQPGQYVVLDFSGTIQGSYRHMDEAAPLSLNDDFVRTWTISSFSTKPTTQFSITVKYQPRGSVSRLLHQYGVGLRCIFRGTSGDFSCYRTMPSIGPKHSNILFIAGGIGITPFLSMWNGFLALRQQQKSLVMDFALLFSSRGDDLQVMSAIKTKDVQPPYIRLFQTDDNPQAPSSAVRRRMSGDDIREVPGLMERAVYICGPDGFLRHVQALVISSGVAPESIFVETFTF